MKKVVLKTIIAASAVAMTAAAVSISAYAAPSAYSSFDNGYITSVKNQGSWGVCWAFAATSASESSLIKEFPEKFSSQTTDLSENLLAYMTSHPALYGHPGMSADIGKYTADTNTYYLSSGGNSQFVGFAYMNGYGPYAESKEFPYSAYGTPTIADYDFTEAEYYELRDSGIVKATGMLTATLTQTADNDNVKQMIMDYGSVVIGYCERKSACLSSDSSGNYYYYCPDNYTPNHDVTIVGWDDSIPASAFKTAPEGDGAWLIKNSWGSSSRDGGYFWLSYYDKSLEGKVAAFDFTIEGEDDYYDKCYSYDGANNFKMTYSAGRDTFYSSNIFTAEEDLIVNGAAFYTAEGNVLEVSVYTDLTSDTSPTSGTKAATKAVNAKYGGYISCTFDSEVKVAKGEKFSIVLKNTAPGGTGYAYLEAATSTAMLGDTYTVSVLEGESFISTTGSYWIDCYSRGGNVMIKAFTVDDVCKNHTYSNTVVKPTLDSEGYTLHTCTKCGYSYKDNYTAKLLPPTQVTGLTYGARSADYVSLRWNKDANADGYIVEYLSTDRFVKLTDKTSGSSVSHKVTGLEPGKLYKFRIRSYRNVNGTRVYAAYSDVLKVRTLPTAMTGLTLGARTDTSISLKWDKNESANGAIVEMYSGGEWITVATKTSNLAVSHKITGLKASTAYKFRVRAYINDEEGRIYSVYNVTLNEATAPSAVTNFRNTIAARTALRFNWDKNTTADGYCIEMVQDGKWVQVTKIESNATIAYAQLKLNPATTYRFRIRAYKQILGKTIYGAYTTISATTAS